MKLESSRQVFEKYSNINSTTIHPVAGELFHMEKRMDTMKLTVTSRNVNAPKNLDRRRKNPIHYVQYPSMRHFKCVSHWTQLYSSWRNLL